MVVYINKEGGDEVSPSVCPTVENPDLVLKETGDSQSLTYSRLAECYSRQAIQARPEHPDRMVSVQSSSKQNAPDGTSLKSTCLPPDSKNKLPQFVSLVPDNLAWTVDALNLSWEDLNPYAFPPVAILGKVVDKLQEYSRVAQHALVWDLVAMSSQIPLCLPNLPNLFTQPSVHQFHQTLHRNMTNLNLHA